MSNKIFRASFSVAIIVLISSVILIMGILFEYFEERIRDELVTEAEYIGHAIETGGLSYFENFDVEDKHITLISPDGNVIVDTSGIGENVNYLERNEIKSALETGSGISRKYSDTFTEKTIYYATRLDDGNILRISTIQYTAVTILLGIMQPFLIVIMLALVLSFILNLLVPVNVAPCFNEANTIKIGPKSIQLDISNVTLSLFNFLK